jgi:hypothetical protein
MAMKTILIASVGGSPDPVVHAIEQGRPDFVYFLCSTGGEHAGSDRTIEQETQITSSGSCPHCKQPVQGSRPSPPIVTRAGLARGSYEIERVNDPDDLAQVVRACERLAAAIAERFAGIDVEVFANYTGGTKAMSFGLGLLRAPRRQRLEATGQRYRPRSTGYRQDHVR